jgi:hypothetical protein
MDEYLKNFIDYLKENLQDELAGVLIFGSYGKVYFDPIESDYDVFVLFKDKIINIQDELRAKFPKVALHMYTNLEALEQKIMNFGWNTYIALIYTGKILFSTPELENLKSKIAQSKPNITDRSEEAKIAFVEKLKSDTKIALEKENYDLNKFLYSSLLRKLQILFFIRTQKIELEFNDLIKKLKDDFINQNIEWLKEVESTVFARSKITLKDKDTYVNVLQQADSAIQKELNI